MAQKVEVLFWIIASSISIPAINDLGLLRIEFQLAFRKPLLKLVQQLASLILAAAVDDGSSRPGGLHPQALTDPDLNVSAHPALIARSPLDATRANERIAVGLLQLSC